MNVPLPADNDLATRLHNYGLAEWIRRDNHNEKLRVAQACVDALDEIQRLTTELAQWQAVAAMRNVTMAELATERDQLRAQLRQSCLDARSDPEMGGCPLAQHARTRPLAGSLDELAPVDVTANSTEKNNG